MIYFSFAFDSDGEDDADDAQPDHGMLSYLVHDCIVLYHSLLDKVLIIKEFTSHLYNLVWAC